MTNYIRNTVVCCAFAGALVVAAAAPSLAQVVVVDPYYGGGYGGPYPYASPYGGYAYAPGYYGRGYLGEDNTGRPYFRDELGWRGGPPSGAPSNPCFEGQRQRNMC